MMNVGPAVIFVGTKPARPHFLSHELRTEIWSGPNGEKLPVLRLRNEQFGSIAVMSHEELVQHRDAVDAVLQTLESGAAVEAKGALDGIVAAFKSKPKEGDTNAE